MVRSWGGTKKKNGGWRMITHLSAPHRLSINDGIDIEQHMFHYSSIDNATRLVANLGRNSALAKVDLKSAFHLIPINTLDWDLLGIYWRGSYYVDKQLPFGLRSALFLFNQFASALHWLLSNSYGIQHLIYDFLIIEQSITTSLHSKNTIFNVCDKLHIALSWEKLEGPATTISFLGIEIDTAAWVHRLPPEKFQDILSELTFWSKRKNSPNVNYFL